MVKQHSTYMKPKFLVKQDDFHYLFTQIIQLEEVRLCLISMSTAGNWHLMKRDF